MKAQLALAGAFLGVALVVWWVFLRPVPVVVGQGMVRNKTYRPAGTYVQYPVGDRQGFWAPTAIPTVEHVVLDISVEGQSEELRYPVSPNAAATLDIGQHVAVEYQERGVPRFWRRSYVLDVKRQD